MNSWHVRTLAPFLLAACAAAWCHGAAPPQKKIPDGVYAVRRDGLRKADLLPLRDGERLVVNHHRYSKGDAPRFVVIGAAPDVALDLAGKPKAIEEGKEVVGILLKLRPGAAAALEKLTGDRSVGQVAVVIGGEVVTMHKVREAIKGGEVKITSCAPKAAAHLLAQLLAREEVKR